MLNNTCFICYKINFKQQNIFPSTVNAINNVSCILKYGNQEKESAVFKRNPSRDLQTKEVCRKTV